MHILGAGKSTVIKEKIALPYANLWTTERFEIICESSLLSRVPQFFKYKYAKKGQKAGRGKDDPVVPHRAGTSIHTPDNELLWYNGSRSHKSQNILHTQHMLGKRALVTEVIEFSEMLLAHGEGMFTIPPTLLKLQGFPQSQQPQLCYSDQSSPAAMITTLLAIYLQHSSKKTWKECQTCAVGFSP